MYMLLHLAALAATVLLLARFLPGVRIRTRGTAVLVAVVFSLLNFFLGWIIQAALFVPAFLSKQPLGCPAIAALMAALTVVLEPIPVRRMMSLKDSWLL